MTSLSTFEDVQFDNPNDVHLLVLNGRCRFFNYDSKLLLSPGCKCKYSQIAKDTIAEYRPDYI